MKSSQIELLEKKVFDKLDMLEQQEFDLLMATDSSFADQYHLISDTLAYASKDKLFDYRSHLNKVHADEIMSENTTKVVQLRKIVHYVASIAAIAMIFLGSYYLINQHASNNALFQQFYHTDHVYMNTRSGDVLPSIGLERGLLLLENKEYAKSLQVFENLSGSITAIYYSGVVNMKMGDYDVAIYKFNQVIKDYLNVFYDQATWYKGLCYLKQNKRKAAQDIFTSISKSDSYYNNQARAILGEMKK